MNLVATSPADQRIAQTIEPVLQEAGFDLVRVRSRRSRSMQLQIMAERRDGSMDSKGCTDISRTLPPILDQDPMLAEGYELEVSSPGMERPLTRMQDFTHFAGATIAISTREVIGQRSRFQGTLHGLSEDSESLLLADFEMGEIALPLDTLQQVKIVPDPAEIKKMIGDRQR